MRNVVVVEWMRYMEFCWMDVLHRGGWIDALSRGGWMDALSRAG